MSEPIVRITSTTAAEIQVGSDVDEVFASTSEGLRLRIVEAVRLLAASAGEPVTAIVIEGGTRRPLIVHPDGTFVESPTLEAGDVGAPAPQPEVAGPATTAIPTLSLADLPGRVTAPTEFASSAPAPSAAAAESFAPVPAESAAPAAPAATPAPATPVEPVPAPSAVAEPAVAPSVGVGGPLRGGARREDAIRRDPTQRATPTVDDLLSTRAAQPRPRANEGWQGAVRRMTGGAISPRPGRTERFRLERERAVQRRLDAPRTIVVLNPKGGAHKTTSTLLLAATFGTQRGGATLAWDNNETRGTLGWRAQHTPHHRTAVDLLDDLDRFQTASDATLSALDTYVRTQVDARFDVLASDEDAAASSTIDAAAFERLHSVLSRYYRLLIVDTGNNMRASNWVAAVTAADQLVIVSTVREDTAASAAWLIDGLREKGFDQKIDEAVTILAAPSAKPDRKLAERLERHFAQVTSAVVHVPFDPALVDGGPIDFESLAPETRDAWLTAAATVAERL
ncbi:MinD/ParA family ATP-binding protein [Microbacterium sp. MC2]